MTLEPCWLNWPEEERNEVVKRVVEYSTEIAQYDSNLKQWPDGLEEYIFQRSIVYISTIDDWDNRWPEYSEWQFTVSFLDLLYLGSIGSVIHKLDLLYYWSADNLGELRGVLEEILERKDVDAHEIDALFEKTLYPRSFPAPPIDWHWKREHLRRS